MNTYFDNSGTSFPKPPQVAEAIAHYLTHEGGTYGRAAYPRVFSATAKVENCRDLLAQQLGVGDPAHLSFTASSTLALNTLIKGLDWKRKVQEGKRRVLVSPLEHNAVMRPLTRLSHELGLQLEHLPALEDGSIDVAALSKVPRDGIALVVVNHQSNVSGLIQPLAEIGSWCAEIPFLVDGSQAVGHFPMQLEDWGVDFYAFTAHKGLLGPTGLGGFYAREPDLLQTLIEGGTGSASDSYDMPLSMPDRFQAGTPNMVGIVGLLAALEHAPLPDSAQQAQWWQLIEHLRTLPAYRVLSADQAPQQGSAFSVVHQHKSPSELAQKLFDDFGLEVRPGLHCAPAAHRFYQSWPQGSTRFALSVYHSAAELDYLARALEKLAQPW